MTVKQKLIRLAKKVADDYPDAADWKDARAELKHMADDALRSLGEEDEAKDAALRGFNTLHTDKEKYGK